jgi:hypothetical protein
VIFVCGETLSLESWIPHTLVSAHRSKSDPPRGTSRMGTCFLCRGLSSTRANCHLPSARKYAVPREIERQQLRYRYHSASMHLHAPSCLQICIHDSSCPGAQVPVACRTRSLQIIPLLYMRQTDLSTLYTAYPTLRLRTEQPDNAGTKSRGRELRGSEPCSLSS